MCDIENVLLKLSNVWIFVEFFFIWNQLLPNGFSDYIHSGHLIDFFKYKILFQCRPFRSRFIFHFRIKHSYNLKKSFYNLSKRPYAIIMMCNSMTKSIRIPADSPTSDRRNGTFIRSFVGAESFVCTRRDLEGPVGEKKNIMKSTNAEKITARRLNKSLKRKKNRTRTFNAKTKGVLFVWVFPTYVGYCVVLSAHIYK